MNTIRVVRSAALVVGCLLYTLWGAVTGNIWVWFWAATATVCAGIALHHDRNNHHTNKETPDDLA